MKMHLPVTLAAAAAIALASAPAFASGAGCPCAAGAAKASATKTAKATKATKTAVKPVVKTAAVAKQTPAKTQLAAATEAIPSISHADLVKAIADKKVTVIDVNGTESFKKGRIPGALDFAAVSGDLKAKLPVDKGALVVAYCGNEYCGAYKRAANAAKALGYTNVAHYSPGLKGWKASGEAMDKG